jgi:hypothetical protein
LNDPNYNGINVYGDETDINMDAFSYFVQDQTRRAILGNTGGNIDVVNLMNMYYGAIGNPTYPTNAQVAGFYTFAPFAGIFVAPGVSLQTFLNLPSVKPSLDNMFLSIMVLKMAITEIQTFPEQVTMKKI